MKRQPQTVRLPGGAVVGSENLRDGVRGPGDGPGGGGGGGMDGEGKIGGQSVSVGTSVRIKGSVQGSGRRGTISQIAPSGKFFGVESASGEHITTTSQTCRSLVVGGGVDGH